MTNVTRMLRGEKYEYGVQEGQTLAIWFARVLVAIRVLWRPRYQSTAHHQNRFSALADTKSSPDLSIIAADRLAFRLNGRHTRRGMKAFHDGHPPPPPVVVTFPPAPNLPPTHYDSPRSKKKKKSTGWVPALPSRVASFSPCLSCLTERGIRLVAVTVMTFMSFCKPSVLIIFIIIFCRNERNSIVKHICQRGSLVFTEVLRSKTSTA